MESPVKSFGHLHFWIKDLDDLKKRKVLVYGDGRQNLRAMKYRLIELCIELSESRKSAEAMVRV